MYTNTYGILVINFHGLDILTTKICNPRKFLALRYRMVAQNSWRHTYWALTSIDHNLIQNFNPLKIIISHSMPYKIIKKVGAVDYEIEMPGRRQERKIYQVNLMKKWHVLTSDP